MTDDNDAPSTEPARQADRSYGLILVGLAIASAVASKFADATLAWTLFLAGLAGGVWLYFDRTPRGRAPAAVWSATSFLLGLNLIFHILPGFFPLELLIGLCFLLMGAMEGVFGMARFSHSRGARIVLGLAGLASMAFGVTILMIGSQIPPWAGGATLGLMFGAFGVALELAASQRRKLSAR